jgi:hypothetical protein
MSISLQKTVFNHHHTHCLEMTNLSSHIDLYVLQLNLWVCSFMNCDMIEYLKVRDKTFWKFVSLHQCHQTEFQTLDFLWNIDCVTFNSSLNLCILQLDTLLKQDESDYLMRLVMTLTHLMMRCWWNSLWMMRKS